MNNLRVYSKRLVILLGPDYTCKGGIASIIKNYLDYRDNKYFDYLFISIKRDGNFYAKYSQLLFGFILMIRFLINKNVDIIHAHPSENKGFWRYVPFYVLAKIFRKKIIFHMHGGSFNDFYRLSNSFKKNIIRKVLKSCDAIITLSSIWENYYSQLGINKTYILPNSVSVPSVNKYNSDCNTITYLGFIEERKGIYDLIIAFEKLYFNYSTIRLNICGSGEDIKLKKMIKNLNLIDCVELHGWISPEKRSQILENSSLFVLPSHYEAMPMSIIEAMAFGVPVVSTSVGSIPEVISDGFDGLLFNPGDIEALITCIYKLLKDRTLRLDMSRRAYEKVKKEFSMNSTMLKLNEIYSSICMRVL